jgi:hypothetical protein
MFPEAAAEYWQDWIEGHRDVPGLRLHTITLLDRMRIASQDENWEQFQRLLQTYSYAAKYCEHEPLLTVYENGLMYVNVDLADVLWVEGDLESSLDHLSWVKETLAGGDARRVEAGMVPRPNSELRYLCLGIKSACCLEDPNSFDTDSTELESVIMISEFWRLAEATVSYLKEKGDLEDERAQTVLHGLGKCELDICKLADRYCRNFLPMAVEFFNNRMGPHLELGLRDFEGLTEQDSRSSWYWDFELSKLESSGRFGRAEVLLCAEQRSAPARLSYSAKPARLLEKPWGRQIARMLAIAEP